MFGFSKKKKLKDLQSGKIPFYKYPDKHQQTGEQSLAAVLPIIFSSNQFGIIKFFAPTNRKSPQIIFRLSSTYLTVLEAQGSYGTDTVLAALKKDNQERKYRIIDQKTKKLAKDIEALVTSDGNNFSDYEFECFWGEKISLEKSKTQLRSEATSFGEAQFVDIEKKFDVQLPGFIKAFLLKSVKSQIAFQSIEELISANDRVRNSAPYSEIWQLHWLAIGTDGSGNDVFIQTIGDNESIYELDHEQALDPNYDPLVEPRYRSLDDMP